MWAAALALIACALAARGEEGVSAECAPEAGERCRKVVNNLFSIDGETKFFMFVGTAGCILDCGYTALDGGAWPRFVRPVRCALLALNRCAPPARVSYVAAMRALNVTATDMLELMLVPKGSRVSALSLRDAPPSLLVSADAGAGVLALQPGALNDSADLRELRLEGVRVDALPPRLELLRLTNASANGLPLNALSAAELTIEDDQLLSIAGSAPRMRELTLTAPALESLRLHNAHLQVLPAGFAQRLGRLRALELELMWGSLPVGFLRGAAELRSLIMIDSELTDLPMDLFSYSLKLEHVDLSGNYLTSLPVATFMDLRQLETLTLRDNRLTAESLPALAPLSWLKELGLSGNPLGALCWLGQPSPLWPLLQLKALHLARTGTTRVCSDWLYDMRALRDLDLRSNNITSLYCAELRVARAPSPSAHIDLTGNNVTIVNCGRYDYMDAVLDGVDTQVVTMTLSTMPECFCSEVWLGLVARERRVVLQAPGWEDHERCAQEYLTTSACDDVQYYLRHS